VTLAKAQDATAGKPMSNTYAMPVLLTTKLSQLRINAARNPKKSPGEDVQTIFRSAASSVEMWESYRVVASNCDF
jgi:hypothetical protein